MKITHVQHPFLPGLGYQENYLPFRQSDLGHDVQILTSSIIPQKFEDQYPVDSFGSTSFSKGGVEIVRLNPLWYSEDNDMVILRDIGNHIRKFRPDVIHSHGLFSPTSVQSYLASRGLKSRLFIDVHIDNNNFNPESLLEKAYAKILTKTFVKLVERSGATFLPVNRQAERMLSEQFGVKTGNVRYLPLGVDCNLFSPGREEAPLREDLEINDNETIFITAGNIDRTKNVEDIIKAMQSSDSSAHLVILGPVDEGYRAELINLAREPSTRNRVHFHGRVEHTSLPYFYRAADVGIWAGKLGMALIEAISAGLPTIVVDTLATKELVSKENGFSYETGDTRELAELMDNYIMNPDLRDSHSRNAITFARRNLSWERIAERSIRFYQCVGK